MAVVLLTSGCWRLRHTNALVLWTTAGVPVQVCNDARDDDLDFSSNMTFDWGDGETDSFAVLWEQERPQECVWHAYAEPGTYEGFVGLVPGHSTEGRQDVTVTVAPAAGQLQASGTCACHTAASFSASGLAASVAVLGVPEAPAPVYHWDFGDGVTTTTATSQTTHVYANPGTYAVQVTVTRAWYVTLLTRFHEAQAWSTRSVRVGP